jgi:hypothetical protein
MASADFVVVEVETSETTGLVTFIRSIWALSGTITVTFLRDTVTCTTLPFRFLTATFLVIVELEFLEATFLVTFIRTIGTLGFTVTHLGLVDTITISACKISIWVAATDLVVVVTELSETAEAFTFIRFIGTLSITITVVGQLDAIIIVTLPFIILAATFLVVIEWEFSKAAVSITFIRTICALGFTVTKITLVDAVTVTTLELILLAATLLVVIERVFLEAAFLVTFI